MYSFGYVSNNAWTPPHILRADLQQVSNNHSLRRGSCISQAPRAPTPRVRMIFLLYDVLTGGNECRSGRSQSSPISYKMKPCSCLEYATSPQLLATATRSRVSLCFSLSFLSVFHCLCFHAAGSALILLLFFDLLFPRRSETVYIRKSVS